MFVGVREGVGERETGLNGPPHAENHETGPQISEGMMENFLRHRKAACVQKCKEKGEFADRGSFSGRKGRQADGCGMNSGRERWERKKTAGCEEARTGFRKKTRGRADKPLQRTKNLGGRE